MNETSNKSLPIFGTLNHTINSFDENNISLSDTPKINYYKNNNNPLNFISPSFDLISHENGNQSNQLNNININYYDSYSKGQTPIMNFDINSQNSENNNQIIKSENISIDTKESSENLEINILPIIENIVSTANLCCNLNLREIALQAKNAEYNPKRFSAVIMKMREPKTTALIFSSGRMVCLGAKNEELSKKACRKFAKIIKSLNYNIFFKEFRIENIVGSVDVKFQISLMKLYIHLIKKTSSKGRKLVAYEPEQFPGLIYRMIEPNIVLLIFVSGKIVLTGGKNRDDIYQGFKNIYPLLVKFKIGDIQKDNKKLHNDFVKKMDEIKKTNDFSI